MRSVKVPPVSNATNQRAAGLRLAPPGWLGFAGFGTVGYSDHMGSPRVSSRAALIVAGFGAVILVAAVFLAESPSQIRDSPLDPGAVPPAADAAVPAADAQAAPKAEDAAATVAADPAAETPAPAAAPAPPVASGPVHKLTVLDLDGKPVSLGTLAGRPMIIEIWATWCGPCRTNRNLIHRMQSELPERVLVVGISVDAGTAGASAGSTVQSFLRSNPRNDHEYLATPEFMAFVRQRTASNSIPKTMYVTAKGQVADLSEGVQTEQWVRAMARNLK
jgi:thiol-disulfide isomerase/thioredoxin